MKTIHRLTVAARCPVDGSEDTYEVTVRTSRVLRVEDIIARAEVWTVKPIYQEELTKNLAYDLAAHVTTVGTHSGVQTTCEVTP